MDRFAKDYQMLLKIRSIRADRAEREMAMAESMRQLSHDQYAKAATASHSAKIEAEAASAARYPKDARSLNGGALHEMNRTATLARARFEDSELVVEMAAADLTLKSNQAEVAKIRFAQEQRILIKTETVLDELKSPSGD